MKELKAQFNIEDFENYGSSSSYLSEEQSSQVSAVRNRVNSQLDWLGQMLGWRGDGYWDGLASNVAQKRRLLGGSYGVYNGFLYPEVLEIQNWSNSIVVVADSRITAAKEIYVGDFAYEVQNITQKGDTYTISLEPLPEQFYNDIADNKQIRLISPQSLPAPFYRPDPGTSGNASFLCEQKGGSLVLYPSHDTNKSLPYLFNALITGCRYYFDKPVSLIVNQNLTVQPQYDFGAERWYLEVPENSSDNEVGLSAVLMYESSALEVSLSPWRDPSDWVSKSTIENFKGVWNNKGGKLPFHFVLDALEIHGFDERKSVSLQPVARSVSFDQLLESVYYQKAVVSTEPPYGNPTSQVWWNSRNGTFSVYAGNSLNCGPWAQVVYPNSYESQPQVDYYFPDVSSFLSFVDPIPEGALVLIEDISGLDSSLGITGITQTIPGPGTITMFREQGSPYWTTLYIEIETESDFAINSEYLPTETVVKVLNSSGLQPTTPSYTVNNLQFSITEQLPLLLMKDSGFSNWFLSPPSSLKYIGNTRLFASSLNYNHPVEGELNWEYSNPDYIARAARIFYYDHWVYNPLSQKYELEGNWVDINQGTPTGPVPQIVDFGTVKVYCNEQLVNPGDSFGTEDFQFSYTVNATTGQFEFSYIPITYKGKVNFSTITISDSLTSAFTFDISHLVFSGLEYYMSPNVLDSETLLRTWKSEKLSVVDSLGELELLRNPNPLVADLNDGPSDQNWERYFLRLPPSYGRNESVWQRVNLVCQDFAYWGSPISPEVMSCPPNQMKPRIYEAVHLYGERPDSPLYLYSEPYLFSAVDYGYGQSDDFDNSVILPSYEQPFDDFDEAALVSYDPLHTRQADTASKIGKGYGEWVGGYYRATPCSSLSGFLVNELLNGTLEPLEAPDWDASIYKLPPVCSADLASSTVDANHFKVGYAFFAADLSVAEDAVFELARVK